MSWQAHELEQLRRAMRELESPCQTFRVSALVVQAPALVSGFLGAQRRMPGPEESKTEQHTPVDALQIRAQTEHWAAKITSSSKCRKEVSFGCSSASQHMLGRAVSAIIPDTALQKE